MPRSAIRLASVLLMVALLLVPLAASAHTHRDPQTAGSCAVCVAAHHAPAIVAGAIVTAAAVLAACAPSPSPQVAPAHPQRSPRAGRAPPLAVPVSFA
jgi:hypothetical protein